jgi:protein-tyrosine phosphatase
MTSPPYRVTFVCMGNICRSPTAHGVFRRRVAEAGLADHVRVDSAGTHDYHPGEPPDPRSQRHARRRGYDLSDLRARVLVPADFVNADLLVLMDEDNLEHASRRCPPAHGHKLRLLATFCRVHRATEVPDPYAGGAEGFEHVLDLVEDACEGLLEHVRAALAARDAPISP